MSLPFIALAPMMPRVAEVYYAAFAPPCVDVTDADTTDSTDVSGGGGGDDLEA